MPLPAPIPSSGPSSSLPLTKPCRACGIDCKYAAKFCVACGFNFVEDDDRQVQQNLEAARLRSQAQQAQQAQQRQHASLLAVQAQSAATRSSNSLY